MNKVPETEIAETETPADRAREEYKKLNEINFDILHPNVFSEQLHRTAQALYTWLDSMENRIEQIQHFTDE